MPRILLIEDDEQFRAVLRTKLVSLGHDVDEAENGKIGIERYRESKPDLVITDLLMPVMEGIETIRHLRAENPQTKIIAMSGGGRSSAGTYLRLAQKLGAAHVLAKPFSAEELELALDVLLLEPQPTDEHLEFLVLDDHPDSRFLNRRQLEAEFVKCSVVECSNIEEALTASRKRRVDAVITDHHLGQSDGSEFVARLRLQGTACPVLMVTGSSDPAVHARAYAAGATKVFFGSNLDFVSYLKSKVSNRRSSSDNLDGGG